MTGGGAPGPGPTSPAADAPPPRSPLQAAGLELLDEFARRCEAAGLRWLAVGGTLLGAVRHEGFIPWDDDIDVAMPRPDFDRFEALCLRSQDPAFAWHSLATDASWPYAYGKLMLTASHVQDPAAAHLPVRQALFIDVFPLDGAPPPGMARLAHRIALKLAVTAIGSRLRRTGLRRAAALPFRAVPRSLARGVLDGLVRRLPFGRATWVVNAGGAWGYDRECHPVARLLPVASRLFEGRSVPVPADPEAYLRQVYGDFRRLPPARERVPRHALVMTPIRDDAAPAARPGARADGGAGMSGPGPAPGHRVRGLVRSGLVVVGTLVVRAGFLAGSIRGPRRELVLATRDTARPGGNLLAIRTEVGTRLPDVPVRLIGYRARPGLRGAVASALEAVVLGYHLASARCLVADDWLFPLYATPGRRGTTRVQVWHAAGAFKRFGFSVTDGRIPVRSNYDLVLASSGAAADHLCGAFRLDRSSFTSAIGLPRTDALFDPVRRAAARAAVRARYALPAGRKVLLYAPTFRGAPRTPTQPAILDVAVLQATLGDEWVVLLRLHPLVRQAGPALDPALAAFAIDASDWPDVNELMLVADLLVTDYSSVIFEFALLGRPMAFLAPDLAAYVTEPGFYLDVPAELPGPVLADTRELADWVAAGRFETGRVEAFARRWFDIADGRAAARFVDLVVRPALDARRPAPGLEPPPEDRILVPIPTEDAEPPIRPEVATA